MPSHLFNKVSLQFLVERLHKKAQKWSSHYDLFTESRKKIFWVWKTTDMFKYIFVVIVFLYTSCKTWIEFVFLCKTWLSLCNFYVKRDRLLFPVNVMREKVNYLCVKLFSEKVFMSDIFFLWNTHRPLLINNKRKGFWTLNLT